MEDRIEKILKEAGVRYEFILLPDDLAPDVETHMKFHGESKRYAMPNMVFKTEKGLVVVQRRGDTQIDNKKLKKELGVERLSLASKEELEKLGLQPGIVPPFGYDAVFFMDRKVFENSIVYTGSSDKLFALKIDPKELLKLNKATVGDFTTTSEPGVKRVLSGIRATGRLHLGNYLGAVKGFLELQNKSDYETFYMVADLHTLSTPYDPKNLKQNVREVVLDYLAAGLNPKESVIFVQSQAPEHVELSYFFSTVVSIARMQHLPTYKDKVKQFPEDNTMALLYYPVLMAADILIYKAGLVPVGIDQEPHLEVAREISRKMNSEYGTDFPEPQRFATKGEYVPSLVGKGKMSKSVEGSYINLTDDLQTIKNRLATAPTDSGRGDKIPESGGVANLLKFVELFEGEGRRKEYEELYTSEGIKYSELKEELARAIYKELLPIQRKRAELKKNPGYITAVLKGGAEKARKVANQTVAEVRGKMGLGT